MSKLSIILSGLLACAIGVIIYLGAGSPKVNVEVVRAEERIKILESKYANQQKATFEAESRVEYFEEKLEKVKAKKPKIIKEYVQERSRVRNLSTIESVEYLSGWLSEGNDN